MTTGQSTVWPLVKSAAWPLVRALHDHWSRADSTGQQLYHRRNADSRDLQLKVKAPSSSTVVGSKGQGHVVTVGRQGEPRHAFGDFPPVVTALDVYKVNILLPTPTMSVDVGRTFETVCLFVCLSVCPQHNSKTNDPKVFKLGTGYDLGIYSKWYAFVVKRSKVKVTGSISPFCILEPLFIHIR